MANNKILDIPNKKINYSPQFRNLVPGENVEFNPVDQRVIEISSSGGGGGGVLPETQDIKNGFVVPAAANGTDLRKLSLNEFLINLYGLAFWETAKDKSSSPFNDVCDIDYIVDQCALRGWPILNIITQLYGHIESSDMVIEYKLTNSSATGQSVTQFLDFTPVCLIQRYGAGNSDIFDPIETTVISTSGPDANGIYTVKLGLVLGPNEATTSIMDWDAASLDFLVQVYLQKQITGQDQPTQMTRTAQGQFLWGINEIIDELIV